MDGNRNTHIHRLHHSNANDTRAFDEALPASRILELEQQGCGRARVRPAAWKCRKAFHLLQQLQHVHASSHVFWYLGLQFTCHSQFEYTPCYQ